MNVKMSSITAMKSPIATTTINWLTSSDSAPLILEAGHDGYNHTPIPMSPKMGNGWIELILLAMGMNISRGFQHFEPKMMGHIVPFFDVKGELTEPTLMIAVARTGRVIMKERNVSTDFIFGQGHSLFVHANRIDYEAMLDASCDVEVTMLKIGDSMLTRLLGESSAHALLKALNVLEVPTAVVYTEPPNITAFLHESLPAHLSGMMRKLYAQAKALEYICTLACHLTVKEAKILPETLKQKQLLQLHEELSRLQGKVPTLDELALKYGISARVMNDGFKKHYGQSIYSYITGIRLTEAHEALLNTDIPMKTIAANMGYSHVNHFISSFGKKFDYSPGKLRRKR